MPDRGQLRSASSIAEKMIKVDHAGENGAVNIYRAQHLVSRLRAPRLLAELRHFQDHEMEHRQIFADYLARHHIRRCVSYHLCGLGGWGLGLVTGLIGPKAVMATTYAVETVVLQHLQHQTGHLNDIDKDAFDCVSAIIQDEQEHHDHAFENIDRNSLLAKALIKVVSLCTEGVIRFGMR